MIFVSPLPCWRGRAQKQTRRISFTRRSDISRMIIRTFGWLRQTVPIYQELAAKVTEPEAAVSNTMQPLTASLQPCTNSSSRQKNGG